MGFLIIGVILIPALIYYLFIVSPALSRQKSLESSILKKEGDLAKIQELSTEWERFKSEKVEAEKTLGQREKNFKLLSFLEALSREVGIQNKIQYIKPRSSSEEPGSLKTEGMEIKLEGIEIPQLVHFLYKIEYSGKLLDSKRIKVQKLSKETGGALRVILQVDTYFSR